MPNTAYTQQALAADPNFRKRVADALATVAWQVINEVPTTPNHTIRANYARVTVLPNVNGVAAQIAAWLVDRTNIMGFATSYDFTVGAVVTAAGDADIQSQLSTDWNTLSGV